MDSTISPVAEQIEMRNAQRALSQACEALTEDQRRVILLKFVQGCSNAEAARILQKPETAVKSLQHRFKRARLPGRLSPPPTMPPARLSQPGPPSTDRHPLVPPPTPRPVQLNPPGHLSTAHPLVLPPTLPPERLNQPGQPIPDGRLRPSPLFQPWLRLPIGQRQTVRPKPLSPPNRQRRTARPELRNRPSPPSTGQRLSGHPIHLRLPRWGPTRR
jgi:hypothetical protein